MSRFLGTVNLNQCLPCDGVGIHRVQHQRRQDSPKIISHTAGLDCRFVLNIEGLLVIIVPDCCEALKGRVPVPQA